MRDLSARRNCSQARQSTRWTFPKNRTWRLFQLAFVLLNLPSLTRLDHPERSHETDAVADLLWFATGGGKTEAYLGLTAYTVALRRLQGDIEGRPGDHGIAVLMRYTLRLLTLQQFQRAAALDVRLRSHPKGGHSEVGHHAVPARPVGRQQGDSEHPQASGGIAAARQHGR